MIFITDIHRQTAELPPCVATIGFFDGVHKGHRYLIEQVTTEAKKRGIASLLITFPTHPREVMQANFQPKLLSTFDEKCTLLSTTKADYCATLPFTRELASLSAMQFMKDILREHFKVQALVIGYDHRFGHNRSEDFEDYCRYGTELGMEIIRARACMVGKINVSSSITRLFLEEGEVSMAARCLGYNYFMEGHVVDGFKIGRTLGFPTANLHVNNPAKLIPADGVYAVRVKVNGEEYKAMLNIGYRPTIGNGKERSIEAHILHFTGDLYDMPMRIEFIARIRGELKFKNLDALTAQLRHDAIEAEQLA